ncbi:type II secretion system protein [Candidatus Magnetominusculus xianensis]|uniref:Prepilin cleavage protein n=1 Tax=Candidatus Magnetominusculus xianensis TaxID=1748249 RepID=A0ABR5SB11_9BACT|nr:type II secretion system protein [Candidatus Magnetominusculus xianensis]KWT75624.1 prepilin cleavage protein [Candidatus Magnetominusculus xianensis]MBF0403707.1 type II secretion system protein [Nitrospirota bacterium]
MRKQLKLLRGQEGFTLIEIIAVLVVLGVLAAIALPKYQNLDQDAKAKACQGAISSGATNLALAYSRFLILNSITPNGFSSNAWTNTSVSANSVNVPTGVGDFNVSYAGNPDALVVSVVNWPAAWGSTVNCVDTIGTNWGTRTYNFNATSTGAAATEE